MVMSATCNTCQFFEMNERYSDREGWCAINKEYYLPTGHCKAHQRIDADQPMLEFGKIFKDEEVK
jgi:hypothetical protein